jgi:hypothetical protein
MHTLNHETLVVVLHRNDALHAKDIGADFLRDTLDPVNESIGIERAIGRETQATNVLIMLVIVGICEKARFDLKHALETEGVAAKHLVEIDRAAFGAMNAGIGIDAANTRFDRGKLFRRRSC